MDGTKLQYCHHAVVAAALNDALFAMYSITAQSELHQQHSSSLYFGLKLLYY